MRKHPKIQTETREESKKEIKEEIQEGREEEKIRLIENPLPLPKKHVKKTMDYRIDVTEEQMKYDMEVREDDDFDLK